MPSPTETEPTEPALTKPSIALEPLEVIHFANPYAYFIGLNSAWFGNLKAPNTLKGRGGDVTNSLLNPREFTALFSNLIFSNSSKLLV